MPVYQNGSTDEIIGMVFVGTDKQEKDMVINQIIWSLSAAVFAVMIVCMIVGMKFASSISKNIRTSINAVGKIAAGDLTVWVDDRMLKQKDETGDLSRLRSPSGMRCRKQSKRSIRMRGRFWMHRGYCRQRQTIQAAQWKM